MRIKMTAFLALSVANLYAIDAQANQSCQPDIFPTLPDVRITAVTRVSTPSPHCKVAGLIGVETNFELLLPDKWNSKFVMGGGGGFAGSVVNAAQDFFDALQKGYATVGTDTGHQAHSMTAEWALNNLERLVSFGHQAVHRTAVTAKVLTEAYYERGITKSYFTGCSRGGGQALMEAQRYPQDFDGIVAQSPAYNWTHELGARWLRIAQLMYPDPNQISEPVIDSKALKLIGDAVIKECDTLDGIKDGILNDPRACEFDVTKLACSALDSKSCLSPEQVDTAKAIYSEYTIDGQVIPGTPVGAELAGTPIGWELWYTGGYQPGDGLEYHEGTDSGQYQAPIVPNGTWAFATSIFKYLIYHDSDWSYLGYNFSDFPQKAARVASTLNADDSDLSAFRARGGKLIIDNGWMDGSMSAYGTINYYENILDKDPTARDDVRLFLRPGVAHCQLGPGPDGTDYLDEIDKWVEGDKAPDQLPAKYRTPDGQATGQGRILCAYPNTVTYNGTGDSRDPSSFHCE